MDKKSNTTLAHTELPSNILINLPMYGKENVQSGDVLTLKRNMTAYMFRHRRHDDNKLSDGWHPIKKDRDQPIRIFAKLMKEGTHDVDGTADMYLLADVYYGIVFELIHIILTSN